ncbi:MAG TPA: NAD-dependent epimerase/dehydratase family protein [bacterium]|nr:NAD-dependent epimerase/dehydratase family protein [bacterium]
MRICIIGGTGHIGENLVKMLLAEKFQVFVVTRGNRPVPAHQNIRFIKKTYDSNVDEWRNLFDEIKPEIIIDILGGSAPILYNAGRLYCKHFIVCGSIWMFGEAKVVPTPENTQSPCIFAGYARRYNDMLKLKDEARMDGVKFTAIMPPNICGPGKIPLDCYGSRDIEHHRQHMGGKPVPLPEPGQTLIGPCDAEDVATGFYLSVLNPEMAADEIFNVGSAYAITAKQFVEHTEKSTELKFLLNGSAGRNTVRKSTPIKVPIFILKPICVLTFQKSQRNLAISQNTHLKKQWKGQFTG